MVKLLDGVALAASPPAFQPFPPEPGESRYLGPYELLEEIGRGGMGVVYRARHTRLRRVVALKLISPHLTSPQLLERFRLEAEAAADLNHPNIVPVYEAGEWEGRHYFSMKLVEGQNLAEHLLKGESSESGASPGRLHRRNQSLTETANLIGKVASAVHYAHQRGILHRDLKPGNILLDGVGEPHVADFGSAKHYELDSSLTVPGELLGTPAYMAPEQAKGNARCMTTASDVYSLGVILFELLTGQRPFEGDSALETLRAVVHDPPPRLRAINSALPRDLETICLTCLEKDPEKRYASAQELADELGRYSRGEPIRARAVSNPEKIWRWCRRNPPLASISGLALVLGSAVLIGAPVALVRIDRARELAARNEDHAKSEAARSAQVARFLAEMLDGVGPSVALGRDATMLQEILEKTSQRVGKDLGAQPAVEAELRSMIGSVYYQLSRYREAEVMYRRALELYKTLPDGDESPAAAVASKLADVVQQQGRFAEAETLAREALSVQTKLTGSGSLATAESLEVLGHSLYRQSNFDEAEEVFRDVLARYRNALENEDIRVVRTLRALAWVSATKRKISQAEELYREALVILRKVRPVESPEEAGLLQDMGDLWHYEKRYPEAETAFREALTMSVSVLGETHPNTRTCIDSLAHVAVASGRLGEFERFIDEQVAHHPQSALWVRARGVVFARYGRWKEAAADLAKVTDLDPSDHWNWYQLAPLLLAAGDHDGYRRHRQAMVTRFGTHVSATIARRTAKACLLLPGTGWEGLSNIDLPVAAIGDPHWGEFIKGLVEYRKGRFASATDWVNKAIASPTHLPDRDPAAYALLAMAQYQVEQSSEAQTALAKALELADLRRPKPGSGDLGDSWHDWIAARVLLSEAKALIGGGS